MLNLVHKSFQAATSAYISAFFTPRTNTNGLKGINKLQLPRVNTNSHGKHSFKLLAPKLWCMLNEQQPQLLRSAMMIYLQIYMCSSRYAPQSLQRAVNVK